KGRQAFQQPYTALRTDLGLWLLQQSKELFGSDQAVSFAHTVDDGRVIAAIQMHANPARRAYVRRHEETLRVYCHQLGLHARRRFEPQRNAPVVMVVVHVIGKQLVAYSKSGRAPGFFFCSLRKRQTDAARARKLIYLLRLHSAWWFALCRA